MGVYKNINSQAPDQITGSETPGALHDRIRLFVKVSFVRPAMGLDANYWWQHGNFQLYELKSVA